MTSANSTSSSTLNTSCIYAGEKFISDVHVGARHALGELDSQPLTPGEAVIFGVFVQRVELLEGEAVFHPTG